MIFISLFILSFLIAFGLFIKGLKGNKNVIFLSVFVFILNIYAIAHYFILVNPSVKWASVFYINFIPLYLLLGPLLHFYTIRSLKINTSFKRQDLLHLAPAILEFIGISAYLFTSFEYKLETIGLMFEDLSTFRTMDFNLIYKPVGSFGLRIVLLLGYTLNNLSVIQKFKNNKKDDEAFSTEEKRKGLLWIRVFHVFVLITVISYTVFTFNIFKVDDFFGSFNQILTSIAGLGILLMSLSLLVYPELSKNISTLAYKKVDPDRLFTNNPYYSELQKKIDTYFEAKKPFLKKKFSRKDLAKALKVPDHHITYCFTYVYNSSFPAYKNEHKVNYLKEILDTAKGDLKIDQLYSQVGFSSKSLMYVTFKEFTGMTPKQYRKEALQKPRKE